tara:strand:+ start:403 stop:747 length:345 start_codon:yes stop_codon:yes gene_type:complete
MKITKRQLKQFIKEELEEAYGRHDPGTRIGPNDEVEGLSPYRDMPDPSRFGSGASPEEIEAYDKRQAEKDPDREYIDMVKGIMRKMAGARVMATDEENRKLIAMAEEEFEMEQQ